MLENLYYYIDGTILLILELVYFKVAERYKIIDKPNERSSHTIPTIRGGGIIFIFALLLFTIGNYFAYPYLVAAVLLSGTISFIDDIRSLPSKVRFSSHLISAVLLILQSKFQGLPIFGWVVLIFLIIAIINAYNFMDGINGITGFYSLAIVLPLLFTETNEELKELELYITMGIIVFLLFNARIKARCFAGDVGSVSLAILIIFLLVQRIYNTGNFNYISFLIIYGADTGLTMVQRLWNKENIFQAHRKHLFQLVSNEFKVPHILVALSIAMIQLGINIFIYRTSSNYWVTIVLMGVIVILYVLIKWMLLNKIKVKSLPTISTSN
ncbi:MAG TPA: glycosyltransferase family 4 protein [Flavipsychrobacter sp.]|nr:glycosyltransferase family 4 protein [Flavipsychrobacter sp.]